MSVTSILSYSNKDFKDFRSLLAREIKKPKINNEIIPPILAPCLSKDHALVGAAFDYYLRLAIEKRNKNVISSKLVAEKSADLLRTYVETHPSNEKIKLLYENFQIKFLENKKTYHDHLVTSFRDTNALLKSCFFFANLDLLYRGVKDPFDILLYCDLIDEEELTDLLGIIKICDLRLFESKIITILNPTFGIASKMIGGADGDLIIDRKLIDIKVTKEVRLIRSYFNQLISYYLLSLIGGIDNLNGIQIDEIGIYFARHNFLWSIKIEKLANNKHFDIIKIQLKQRIEKYR